MPNAYMMDILSITPESVITKMTEHNPDWMIERADPRDLQHAITRGMTPTETRDYLARSQTHFINSVIRAVYHTDKQNKRA